MGGTGGGFRQTSTIFIIKCLFLQNSFQKITRVDSQVSGLAQLTVLNFLVLFYEDPWEKIAWISLFGYTCIWRFCHYSLKSIFFFYFDRSITLCFGVSSNLSQEKSPTAEILHIYFLGTIVRRKHLPKISAVGLFSCHKFEETPKQKVIDLSKFK